MTRLHIDPYDANAADAAVEAASLTSRSPRPQRHTCTKQRYQSKRQAIHALHTIQIVSNRQHVPERTYECDWCSGWHLTSQPSLPEQTTTARTQETSGLLVDLDLHRAWASLHDPEADDDPDPDDDPTDGPGAGALPAPIIAPVIDLFNARRDAA